MAKAVEKIDKEFKHSESRIMQGRHDPNIQMSVVSFILHTTDTIPALNDI